MSNSEIINNNELFCVTHSFRGEKKAHEADNCEWVQWDEKTHHPAWYKAQSQNEKFSFESIVGEKRTKKDVLDYKIKTLRPITFFKEDNTKMILVYLPTKKTVEKIRITNDGEEVISSEIKFVNSAYFLTSKNDSNGKEIREMIPFDDDTLKESYRINILAEWEGSIRWDILDCKKWVNEKNISNNPKELYDLLDKTTRKYLEYDDIEYTKFNLWGIATYFYELFPAFPYYDFTGTKRAGKTKSLEFQKQICYNAIMSSNVTGSSLFRITEGIGATILLDETEEFKNKKNEQAQTVRNLLMQAFLKDQYAIRSDTTKDKNFTPTQYNIFSPKSLAHINSFDDVLEDRCLRQTMKRALNENIINTNVSGDDPSFQVIRNKCYKLFLEYADQIYDLQEEAATKLGITGRELQLWVPIMTLAVFFEKFGVDGLTESVILNMKKSKEDRQLSDEEESKDLKVLDYLSKFGIDLALNEKNDKAHNPIGWIAIQLLYNGFSAIMQGTYQINPEFFTRRTLSKTLDRFGFNKTKKQDGISYLITKTTVDDVKLRMGIIEYSESESNNNDRGSNSEKISSDSSFDSEIGTKPLEITKNEKFRNELTSSDSSDNTNESSDGKSQIRHKSELNESNELNEVKTTPPTILLNKSELMNKMNMYNSSKSSDSSEKQFRKKECTKCNTEWNTSESLEKTQIDHSKNNPGHIVKYSNNEDDLK